MKKKISLGFSPCPNDTFIFDALVNNKIDTEGFEFDFVFGDVEELNRKAFHSELGITKISFNAYTRLCSDYILLNSGSALGPNCGPLLISKNKFSTKDIDNLKIAIPGINTTANLLLTIAFPYAKDKKVLLFSDIEKAVLNGEVDAGLIIHENRFTYEQKGLQKIIDMGELWEKTSNSPVPLGGIIAKRSLGSKYLKKIDKLIRRSVEFAFENPESGMDFIRKHAQEMDDEVIKKHIALYVNNYTIDLGEKGKKAVKMLFDKALEHGLTKKTNNALFL